VNGIYRAHRRKDGISGATCGNAVAGPCRD